MIISNMLFTSSHPPDEFFHPSNYNSYRVHPLDDTPLSDQASPAMYPCRGIRSHQYQQYHRSHRSSTCSSYNFKYLALFFSLLFIEKVLAAPMDIIDRTETTVMADLRDLNDKIASSEKVLLKLLTNIDVQSATDLKEHVEKMLDYLRFRRDGINTWQISRQQFEKMKDGINKDFAALPFKIVHILSQASKKEIIHIVPFNT
ncbi:uncharacterized protein LOC141849981 [Brevipalpus obovatus]|uniref:uncharacterized protein LOC141849981 n=1 Tax=Brevipalpus obovatus TaxID=246614 RepID=UPI003D9DDD23